QRDLNLRGLNLLANVGTWGTAPGVMLEIAAMAIATGQATTVACVMGSAPFKEPGKSAGQSFAAASNRHAGWQGIKDSTGGSPGINLMAMMARRHKNTYGWEDGTLGHVAVAQRAWAQLNPKA